MPTNGPLASRPPSNGPPTNGPSTAPAVELRDATVTFGDTVALNHVNLTVAPGEVVALVGPSGCGKTTLLRTIVGLQPLDGGQVMLGGEDVEQRRPEERAVGLMFQDDVLFPHFDVIGNVSFGLRMRNWGRAERRARALEMLELVGLSGFGERNVATLSGGERQRVGLARSLAPKPEVLLLDEPFGALDRPLRERLVDELGPLLATQGVSAIAVTHDHDEAYALGDRVAVMIDGQLKAVGEPADIWRNPGTVAVARFLGHRNTFTAAQWHRLGGEHADSSVVVRADRIQVDRAPALMPKSAAERAPALTVTGTVARRRFVDGIWELLVDAPAHQPADRPTDAPAHASAQLQLHVRASADHPVGAAVTLTVPPDALITLDE